MSDSKKYGTLQEVEGDLKLLGAGLNGLILYDVTLAGYYRLTLDNGVLILTAV
jgi:hypothetical protein